MRRAAAAYEELTGFSVKVIEYDRDGCKVKEIRYNRNDFVTVRRQDTLELGAGRDQDFWVARILQVRAANKRNVYALVSRAPLQYDLRPLIP